MPADGDEGLSPSGQDAAAHSKSTPPTAAVVQPPAELELTVTAVAPSASLVRDRVRAWLERLTWVADELNDVLLAVSEAVSNSVEHAYPEGAAGLVDVHGRVFGEPGGVRRIHLVVRDHGSWRPIPTNPDGRRRGIPLMRACMAEVTINGGPDGTTVVMRNSPAAEG